MAEGLEIGDTFDREEGIPWETPPFAAGGTGLGYLCQSSHMKPISVLLVDDHSVVRQGLRMLLEQAGKIKVAGEAASGREALRVAQAILPDVVVMDLAMPLLNGFQATRQLASAVPSAKVLVLSSYGDELHVQEALAAGVAGYVLKQMASVELVKAIQAVARGERFFGVATTNLLRGSEGAPAADQAGPAVAPKLSTREGEVLQLVAEGYPNKQIASELGISTKTVEKHRQTLMEKLSIHNTAGLTRYAIANRVIERK
jgi:DNA-binding NarL/FixJ family response regulator